jgi:hypothetical protein
LKKTENLFGNVFLQELNVRQEINTLLCVEEKGPDFRLLFFEFNKPYHFTEKYLKIKRLKLFKFEPFLILSESFFLES